MPAFWWLPYHPGAVLLINLALVLFKQLPLWTEGAQNPRSIAS